MSWTDERVETLKKMWAEGQSASQIAKELGGVTRNAVIGKVHRLGLSNRAGGLGVAEAEEDVAAAPATEASRMDESDHPDDDLLVDEDHADAIHAQASEADPRADAPPTGPQDEAPRVADRPAAAAPAASPAVTGGATITPIPLRKAIVPAGQPLPPQPSANEISPEALASVREVEKHAKRLTLMELTERTCKWPIGDPATEDFWFCGLSSLPGKPYCEAHVGVAFQPMSARRDRRR